jgi:hypothetical protein
MLVVALRSRGFLPDAPAQSTQINCWGRAMSVQLDTRTILIALVAVNAIAIGLSEIQRRTLVAETLRAQAHFEERANRVAQQQAEALDRMVKQLSELNARVNHTEILTFSVPQASSNINDISARVMEMQKTLQEWKQSRPPQ